MTVKNYAYYSELLEIDRDSLDSALIEQPQLIQEVGERFVEAVSERDYLYDEVSRVDANLDSDVRADLEEELGKKPTEAMVSSSIITHDDHIEIKDKYLQSKKDAEAWRILRDSFMERSKALRELGNLYMSGYFAIDSVSDDKEGNAQVKSDGNKKRVAKAKRDSK